MRVRLTGTASECAAMIEQLRAHDGVAVLDVSGSYANRGDSQLQRVYLEVRVDVEGVPR